MSNTVLQHIPAPIPIGGSVMSAILEAVTIVVLVVCLARRLILLRDRNWREIPMVRWLIYIIYIDSLIFIVTTTILTWGFGLNKNLSICATAIYLCLVCYMSTKILIYYFLVEKVFIVRSVATSRLKSKLYCFNCFGMLLPYAIIVVFNFIFKISYFTPNGTCIIGMELKVLMPLIIFDAIINAFLTLLFIIPLRGLYSYKTSPNPKLRRIAFRSFIGSCGTLTSSIVNLTILMVLRGEAAWICLLCCNSDILFSVVMLHWVTSKDSPVNSSLDRNSKTAEPPANQLSSLRNKLNPFSKSVKTESQKGWIHTPNKTTTVIECGTPTNLEDGIEDRKGGGINVEIGHSVVVERDGRSVRPETPGSPNSLDDVKLSPRGGRFTGSSKSDFTFDEERGDLGVSVNRNNKSTEDLVEANYKV